MKIYRNTFTVQAVEVPEGYKVCEFCEGKGMVSKYDMGWRSLVHDEDLAALRPCLFCQGKGYVREG